ncbi:MAG: carbohydrate-binding family 9-like protein [Candidatus Latescibacterota bacterium]
MPLHRFFRITFTAALLTALPLSAFAQVDVANYTAIRAAGAITVDGKLDEADWSRAAEGILTETNTGNPVALKSTVRVLWDDRYLYVGFHFEDPDAWATITAEDGSLWNEEVAEVFIDPEGLGHSYYEHEINPVNTKVDLFVVNAGQARNGVYKIWKDWDFSSQLKQAVFVRGDGLREGTADEYWSVEVAFPFEDLWTASRFPQNGDMWRIGCYRIERGKSGNTPGDDWYAALSPGLRASFHSPWRFAKVTFADKPSAVQSGAKPEPVILSGNYPNPFNPATTIEFTLPKSGKTTLTVYNSAGQKIRELLSDSLTSGVYRVFWDGRDDAGRSVSSGTYLYRIGMEGFQTGGKMEIMK